VVVVSVFIVCELPDLGLRSAIAVMEFTSDRRQSDVDVLRRGNTITNALLAFNSSVNFIIYWQADRRRQLRQFRNISVILDKC